MPPSSAPLGCLVPWPGDSGPPLAAIWASLAGPGMGGAGLLPVDMMAAPASGTVAIAVLAGQRSPAAWPEGVVAPDGFPPPVPPTADGPGAGFGQGDRLDVKPPGVVLAGLAEDAHGVLAKLDDDCLTGIIRPGGASPPGRPAGNWRLLPSWPAVGLWMGCRVRGGSMSLMSWRPR